MADPPTGQGVSVSRAHPLAHRLMRLLEHRDEADMRLVFAALSKRQHPAGDDGRRGSALLALDRCAGALGVDAPTARTYAAWRESSPDGLGAPSVQQIRSLFDGRWSRAIGAMPGTAASDPLSLRLTAQGPRFTNAECVAALQRWHRATGETVGRAYIAWARQLRRAEPELRIPAHTDPIQRRFGTWSAALDAARIQRPRQPKLRRTRPGRVKNATRQEIIDALTMAYDELGEPFSISRYEAWVRRKADEHGDSDAPFRLSSPQVITSILGGTWRDAINEVFGRRSGAELAVRQRGARYTQADLRHAWWACRSGRAESPTASEYERWRHSQAQSTGFTAWPPSEASIRMRSGGRKWAAVCALYEEQGPPSDETACDD